MATAQGCDSRPGEHGGDYPDNMPQSITVTDRQGRWAVYVPLRVGGKIVVPEPPAIAVAENWSLANQKNRAKSFGMPGRTRNRPSTGGRFYGPEDQLSELAVTAGSCAQNDSERPGQARSHRAGQHLGSTKRITQRKVGLHLTQVDQSPAPCCGNATCTASSMRIWLPSTTGAVFARATDPCALWGCDADCAMTGDARTAMASAARIIFRFVFIVDLTVLSLNWSYLSRQCEGWRYLHSAQLLYR